MLREHIATKATVGFSVGTFWTGGKDRTGISKVEVDPTNVTCFNQKNNQN